MKLHAIDTLVIAGTWNIAIFTEDWVRANILVNDELMNIMHPKLPFYSLKFDLDKISFYITPDRLNFQAKDHSYKAYTDIVKYCRVLCRNLGHTPVNELGVNFEYEMNNKEDLLDGHCHNEEIISALNCTIDSWCITRRMSFDDGEQLNLRFTKTSQEALSNFNFYRKLKVASDVLDIFGDSDDFIKTKKDKADEIMGKLKQALKNE